MSLIGGSWLNNAVHATNADGYYNAEKMIRRVIRKGRFLLCGTCMDARGLSESELVSGAERSTMDAPAEETIEADKVLVF